MSESYEEFTERFLTDLQNKFKDIDSYKSSVSGRIIKMKMYGKEWEQVDYMCLHQICIELGRKYKSEFEIFKISDTPILYVNGEKGKVTAKWCVNIDSWPNPLN